MFTSIKFRLKQTWQLTKAIAEKKPEHGRKDEIGVAVKSWL